MIVETVAYQKTLAWLLKKAMQNQKRYFVIKEQSDRRSKYDRIVDGLSGPASNEILYVKKEHTEFISQFRTYPNVSHDDLIEATAVAVEELHSPSYDAADESWVDVLADEEDIPALVYAGGAP